MILITGCAGFIGYHLALCLLKKNKKILGIDNLNSYYDKGLKIDRLKHLKKFTNFKFYNLDLTDFKKTNKNLKKNFFSTIVHLAAQPGVRYSYLNPRLTLYNNLNSFNNIIEISRLKNIKKFIYASSSSVYGEVKKIPFSENDMSIKPISIYGASKFSNEIIASAYSRNYKLNCFGLRFFTVYGPYGRPDMAYYSFAMNNLKNEKIELYNNGNMLRDFTYVDDVVAAIIKIIYIKSLSNSNHIFNVGKGKPDKLKDLVFSLEKRLKNKFKIYYKKFIPKGDIKKTYSDNTKIKRVLKWSPKVSLDKGIEKFVDWLKKNH